jgi:hypothetical protein
VKLSAAKVWGVQLAAGFDRDKALAMYARAVTHLSAVVGGRDPSILSSVQRSRGSHAFYQVRIGADTRNDAVRMCQKLHAAGAACLVLRNSRGAAEAIGTSEPSAPLNAGSGP